MTKVRVHAISMSLDGFIAGPGQDLEHPMGNRGELLHEWVFTTRAGRAMIGESGGAAGIDDDTVAAGFDGIGATIMGRNMFGPVRGPWGTVEWNGWWGSEPPFHHTVFVLTHHPRAALEMEGGTTFHFVTDGPEAALELARQAAGELDIRLGGGAATIRKFMRLGLIDEMHVAVVPAMLGSGERIFDDTGKAAAYRCTSTVATDLVTHYHLVPDDR